MSILNEMQNQMKSKDLIIESGLSRVFKHMSDHDCGIITASRYAEDCGRGRIYSKADNKKRTKVLEAQIQSKRYGITSMNGTYIENYGSDTAKEVGENVLFVVDLDDKGNLFEDLKKWGEEWEQDSILFIPKIGSNEDVKSILYGTNHCEQSYPGYGNSKVFNQRVLGQQGEFFTKVSGRPFIFNENVQVEHYQLPQGFFGRMGCNAIAKSKWQDIK